MHWNFRTFLRLFLLLAGGVFFALGIADGDVVQIVIGGVAVVLGAVGLAYEWHETTNDNT